MSDTLDDLSPARPGPLTRWGPVIVILASLALYLFASRPPSPPPGWKTDFVSATEEAQRTGRNLVVDFYGDG